MKTNIFTIVTGILIAMTSISSFAKDESVIIDDKKIVVTDSSKSMAGSTVIKNSNLNDGVYIVAGNLKNRFPNAEKVIIDRFKLHGIKVSDDMEKSSVAIGFDTPNGLDMAKADQSAAHSSLPSVGKVGSMGAQAVGAVLSGGAAGLVGFAVGALWDTDSYLSVSAVSHVKPVYKTGFFNIKSFVSSVDDGIHNHYAKVSYKLEKGKEASDDVVLKMAVDQWIKNFIVFDTAPDVKPVGANVASASPEAVPTAAPAAASATSTFITQKSIAINGNGDIGNE
jgi:hypothetical protein